MLAVQSSKLRKGGDTYVPVSDVSATLHVADTLTNRQNSIKSSNVLREAYFNLVPATDRRGFAVALAVFFSPILAKSIL